MEEARTGRNRRRGPLMTALLAAAAVNAGVLLVAGFVVVARALRREEPVFAAQPVSALPQRRLEFAAAVAEYLETASRPALVDKLVTTALLPAGLPAMPDLPVSEMTPLDTEEFLAEDADALLAAAGLTGGLGGITSAASAASFFGIEDTGERIVLVVNTSASVLARARNRGVTVEKIQEEVLRLVDGLAPASQFGIVQFSQGVRTFADHLVPAVPRNVEAVRRWIPENLRGSPRAEPGQRYYGHEAALAAALAYAPDVIFLVTDGQLERREGAPGNWSYPEIPYGTLQATVRRHQRENPAEARIHVVGFEMEEDDAESMRRLAREYGGQAREF